MSRSSQVSAKTAASVTATALLVCIGAWLLWEARLALLLIAVSLLIAVALNHVVAWLERRGWRRGLAIAASLLALLGVMVGLGWLVVPALVEQVKQFITAWPHLLRSFEKSSTYHWLDRHFDIQTILAQLQSRVPSLVGKALVAVTAIVEMVAGGVTVLFIVTFMLISGRPLVWALFAQMRPRTRKTWADTAAEVYRVAGGYVLGLAAIVFTQMLTTSLWLLIFGVPYFLPLGVMSGLASLIPFGGALVMGTLVSFIAWGAQGFWTGIATAAYYLAYQQLENHLLAPIIYRRTVQVNPLAILIVILVTVDLAGVVGAIFAVPLTAAGQIVLLALLAHRNQDDGPAAP